MELKKLGKLGSGQTVFDRPRLHLHASVIPLLEEALAKVETAEPFLATVVSMGRVMGESTCVETSNRDQIVYAQRPERKGPSRFVKNREPIPCQSVVVVLKRVQGGNYLLITAFIGFHTHVEPWDERATEEDAQFWANHALIWESDEIIPGTEGVLKEFNNRSLLLNYRNVDPKLREIFDAYYRLHDLESMYLGDRESRLDTPFRVLARVGEGGQLEAASSYEIEYEPKVKWLIRGWWVMLRFTVDVTFVLYDQYGHCIARTMPVVASEAKYRFDKSWLKYPEAVELKAKLRPFQDAVWLYGSGKVEPGHAVDYKALYRKYRDQGLFRGVAKRKALAEREVADSRCFAWRVYRANQEDLDKIQTRLDAIEQKVQGKSVQLQQDREMIREKLEELRSVYPGLVEKNLEEI